MRYLVFSDVHLGNLRNPAWRIVQNLYSYFDDFSDQSQFVGLDIIFIAGDFFDKALWLGNEDLGTIINFVLALFNFCEKHGIALRYLEGTFSHDRKQFKNLVGMAAKFPLLDFRYIEDMCVEAFYDLGITCLYVPDEHEGGGEKSQALIQQKLDDLGVEKVSIGMVHSWFKYQVPEVASKSKYDERFFLDRVIYYINNGHIHGPSTFERIIGQGSFDRIAHKEEHAKGGVLVELSPTDCFFYFIENKNALPFRTLHVKTMDLDKVLEQIDKLALSLPEYSWLRIKAKETHPILNSLEQLGRQYQHVRFEKITEEEEDKKANKQLVDQTTFENMDYVSVEYTKHNIVGLVLDELHNTGRDNHDGAMVRQLLEAAL